MEGVEEKDRVRNGDGGRAVWRELARGSWSLFGEQFHDATERDSEDRHSRAADEAADVVNPRESGARDIIMKSGSKSSYVGKKGQTP